MLSNVVRKDVLNLPVPVVVYNDKIVLVAVIKLFEDDGL